MAAEALAALAMQDTQALTSPEAEAPATAADRVWFVVPAAIALASRVFSALVLLQYTAPAKKLPRLVGDPSPFVAWDGQWYLHIAQFGYHALPIQPAGLAGGHHDFAFYPVWPLLIRLVSLDGLLPMGGTAVVLTNALFILAVPIVYRLFVERFDKRTALGAIVLLSFNPVAYVFTMAYTESLFVLVAALYFMNRYWRWAPLLAGLSVLVRVSGLAIGASAAAMLMFRREDGRLRALLAAAAVALAFAAWWVYIWKLTGDFTGFLEGSASWARYEGTVSIVRELKTRAPLEALWSAFVVMMALGSLALFRRHPDLAVYGLVAIGLSLVGAPANSMPRHSMVAFPAFAALSERLGPRLSIVAAVGLAVLQLLFVDVAFGALHQPP